MATRKLKLTQTTVARAEFDPDGSKVQYVWDTELTGFCFQVAETGRKTFYVTYRNQQRKKRFHRLGVYGEVSVADARERAKQVLAQVWQGEDPADTPPPPPDALTFAELAQQFIDEHARPKKKSWETDYNRLFPRTASKPIYQLHPLDFTESSREEVEDLLHKIHAAKSATPVEANRLLQLVNAVLNYASRRRRIDREFRNIIEDIDLNRERPRKDYLRPKELPRFFEALLEEPTKWKAATLLTLLTGARMQSEVLSLKWDEVHLDLDEFTFRNTKNREDHTLPITQGIRAVFDAVQTDSVHVFPGPDPRKPLNDPKKLFARIRQRAQFADHITPHALRHTAVTLMRNELGQPDGVVRAVLNHAEVGMTDRYATRTLNAKRETIETYEDYVLSAANIGALDEWLTTSI